MFRRRGRLGLRLDDGLVHAGFPGGPSDRAGLRVGDAHSVPRNVLWTRLRALCAPVLAMWGASQSLATREEHLRIAALTGRCTRRCGGDCETSQAERYSLTDTH